MSYAGDIAAIISGWMVENALEDMDVESMLERPPARELGDWAFPCFKLSKALRMAPDRIAARMAEELKRPDYVKGIEAKGGYLNFYLEPALFAGQTLERVLEMGTGYGASDEGAGKTIVLDYSSINITKRFHLGHLSTTMIGSALSRVFKHMGYKTVGINHLGDWGTQFGKMLEAFERWSSEEEIRTGGLPMLEKLYKRFHEVAERDPSLETSARRWFKRIEDGDPEALRVYGIFKQITLDYAYGVYDMLDVHFDSYAGEAFYNDKMQRVIDELEAKGLLIESDGAKIVDLEAYGMPPCLILKSDGATLYHTRDLAAALYRADTYGFDRCLYVVAYQQDLHFRQLFKVLELMGYDWAKRMEHVSYGMVTFEGQAMATRKGHVAYLDELLRRAVEKARGIIEEKSPDLPDKDIVARQVGVGAVIFQDLYANRIKDIDFRWERALNFDGETGPYAQYTHARCCSVLAKASEGDMAFEPDYGALAGDESMVVIDLLSQYPEKIAEAARTCEPSLITRHIIDVAQAYNHFYYEQRILDDDPGTRAARLRLTAAVRDVIKGGLRLIGVSAPERM